MTVGAAVFVTVATVLFAAFESHSMSLETMDPDPVFNEDAYTDTIDTLAEHDELAYIVWGGDWCGDCRAQLPTFGAALQAAGVDDDRVEEISVEKLDDGSKAGPKVEEYGIEYIPTVVVERVSRGDTDGASRDEPRAGDGEEIARFVEEEPVSIPVYLAERIREHFGER